MIADESQTRSQMKDEKGRAHFGVWQGPLSMSEYFSLVFWNGQHIEDQNLESRIQQS